MKNNRLVVRVRVRFMLFYFKLIPPLTHDVTCSRLYLDEQNLRRKCQTNNLNTLVSIHTYLWTLSLVQCQQKYKKKRWLQDNNNLSIPCGFRFEHVSRPKILRLFTAVKVAQKFIVFEWQAYQISVCASVLLGILSTSISGGSIIHCVAIFFNTWLLLKNLSNDVHLWLTAP